MQKEKKEIIKKPIKTKNKYFLNPLLVTIFLSILLFLLSLKVFTVMENSKKQYNNLKEEIHILKKSNLVQVELREFISNNIKMLEHSKMTDERKIQFLGLIFTKSLENRDKFYLKPDFVLFHVRQESGFNEEAKGKVGELGLYQFHPLKRMEACVLYQVTEEQFIKSLELQTDYYFHLMTNYLEFYKGDLDKALLTYNGGEGIIESFNGNLEYLKKVVYIENKINPREPYSDTILNKYKESL